MVNYALLAQILAAPLETIGPAAMLNAWISV